MSYVFFWFVLSIGVGIIAASRGRSGLAWFFLALLISPLLAVIAVAIMPAVRSAPALPTADSPLQDERIPCPECAEPILRAAKKCKHCGATVTPTEKATLPATLHPHGIKEIGGQYFYQGKVFDRLEDAERYAQNTP